MNDPAKPNWGSAQPSPAYHIGIDGLERLFDLVLEQYDDVFGPRVKDGAITLERLNRFAELPVGCHDEQRPGSYAIRQTNDQTLFHYAVGPHAVKRLLHPANRRLWRTEKTQAGWEVSADDGRPRPIALFGVRSCDVESIDILDQVFTGGDYVEPHYQLARQQLLLITASCPAPSAVCFCTSMGHGPRPRHYDINLTEINSAAEHYFVADAGTQRGQELLASLAEAARPADMSELQAAEACIDAACNRIEKKLDTTNLAEDIAARIESPHWRDVGERCLACGNCTMVCPTCFCTTTYDVTDLDGAASEHWQSWDSCFNADFSYLNGGAVRQTVGSRYRQWLSHKLSTWHDQFGRSGCVGCGRCVTWCPVEIDIVEETRKLRG